MTSELKCVFMVVVVALHAGLAALLLTATTRRTLPLAEPSIEVQLTTENPVTVQAPPLPPPTLERPHLDLVQPDVPLIAPASDAPVPVPPASPPPAASAPSTPAARVPADPVIPPRFDAAYLNNPAPVYPLASRRLREQGTVLLRVHVSRQGTPLEVLIERTSGSSRLDEAALGAVRQWHFAPARQGSAAVEAWVLVPVEFALHR